ADAVRFVKQGSDYSRQYQGTWHFAWGAGYLSALQTTQTINDLRRKNINTMLPQIRKTADAYYISTIEPRATNITSGYVDPLADILAKAHDTSGGKQRIEVHGWFVPYRVWTGTTKPPAGHVSYRHPEWRTRNEDGSVEADIVLDPGVPEVQEYLLDVIRELVTNYPDLDGLHFDYIRYMGRTAGYHPTSVSRFQQLYHRTDIPAATDEQWGQFRRDQILALVRKAYVQCKQIRWGIKMSASTVTWLDPPLNGDFTTTRPYNDVFCDWPEMMREGILDMNCPMVYMRDHTVAQYDGFRKWTEFAGFSSGGRHVLIGPGSYLNYIENHISQLLFARDCPGVAGTLLYRYGYTSLEQNETLSWQAINGDVFDKRREVPDAPWLTNPSFGIACGTVRDVTGTAVDGALLSIGTNPEIQKTDGTGFYAFVKLPAGSHSIYAHYEGKRAQGTCLVEPGKVTTVDLTLDDGDSMMLRGPASFVFRGYQDGPFTPVSETTFITNTGDTQLTWTSSKAQPWLVLNPTQGVLSPEQQTVVSAFWTPEASSLAPGEYSDNVVFENSETNYSETVPAQLIVMDAMELYPEHGWSARGTLGGPFSPSRQSFLLTNRGSSPLEWTAMSRKTWLDVQPSAGILAPEASETVTVSINAEAGTLPPRDIPYTSGIVFSDLTHNLDYIRYCTVQVGDVASMPFWETFENGLASYWETSGSGDFRTEIRTAPDAPEGSSHLTMDSASGSTEYVRNELNLTIDLSGQTNVILSFWAKGYGVEPQGVPSSPFTGSRDFNGVAVSEDGLNWHMLHSLDDLPPYYTMRSIKLDDFLDARGLSYSSRFRFRFNYYGSGQVPSQGIAIDDIHIAGSVPSDLVVAPAEDFYAIGDANRVFLPSSKVYTLTNSGTGEIIWSVFEDSGWFDIEPLNGVLAPGASQGVEFTVNSLARSLEPGKYLSYLFFINETAVSGQYRTAQLRVAIPDYFTEIFENSDNDLSYISLAFHPDERNNTYHLCIEDKDVVQFPTNPSGGTPLILGDNTYVRVVLTDADQVSLYGKSYTSFFVGSNGYITLGQPDVETEESLLSHFTIPRISALFDDLDPIRPSASVSWKRLGDRIAVTYQNVPEYNTDNRNSFQIEMFFNGTIRITYLGIAAKDGLAGLSAGLGIPHDFTESDLTTALPCGCGTLLLGK
ncbi:MAG TPA: family 10 glycosylhydrolase, partial [bacterium]|nr:family 10 glycosylhydrolase [bacterium]